jgi:SAM-dependent methyltransferase
MGWYRERVLPHLVDRALRAPGMADWRRRTVVGLRGTVVEIGFGSGLNVPHYPPEVEVVLAVEPALLARRLAAPRIAATAVPVRHIGLDGQRLPLDDASCDGALSTFTLCTIPDVATALGELARVLRPGATFHLLEHGVAPDAGIARLQRLLDPLQHRVADGCHLTRDPLDLVTAAGFRITEVEQAYAGAPSPWGWLTCAVATR